METKDFDAWNHQKKSIHALPHGQKLFHEREVWWCAIGLNVGVEVDGKHVRFERPVLILRRFNKHMFWGIPLTRAGGGGLPVLPVSHQGSISRALLTQLKTMSVRRLRRRIDKISPEEFRVIQHAIVRLIISGTPHSMGGSSGSLESSE